MSVELSITVPHFDDPSKAANYLTEAIRTLREENQGEEVVNVSFPGLFFQHDNWSWGDPCPKCGSEDLCVGEITYSEQHPTDEHLAYGERLDFTGGIVRVSCNDTQCLTDLYVTPAGYLSD